MCDRFDENILPANYEDNDCVARLALANQTFYVYGGATFYHFGSRTINSDEEFRATMPPLCQQNASYFFQKWGHTVVNEPDQTRRRSFDHPYNEPDKPLGYWEGGEAACDASTCNATSTSPG